MASDSVARSPIANVIVVGYNGDRWLPDCIASLETASVHRIGLTLVDNYNNPCIASLNLRNFSYEVLTTPRPMGFAEANDFALVKGSIDSPTTVFLNQDTISTERWIDQITECLDHHPDIGALSPGLKTYDFSEWEPNLLACLEDSGVPKEVLDQRQLVRELKYVTAAAMAVRTEVLREVGPFDPLFGSYYEDYDLCRRIKDAGYGIGACTGSSVGHFQGSVSLDPIKRQQRERIIIRNRLIHRLRESGRSRSGILLEHFLCSFPRNLLRGIMRTPSSQAVRSTLGAQIDVLKILPRLISQNHDSRLWTRTLNDIGWTSSLPSSKFGSVSPSTGSPIAS